MTVFLWGRRKERKEMRNKKNGQVLEECHYTCSNGIQRSTTPRATLVSSSLGKQPTDGQGFALCPISINTHTKQSTSEKK